MKKLQRILDCEIEGTASLDIDSIHLFYHNAACQQLYHQLVQYPMEIVPLMDIMVQRELGRLAQNMDVPLPHVQVRPFNLKTVSNLRELDPVSMDCLVCCKGMIVRSSAIIPDLKVAHFGCAVCGNSEVVTIDRGRISEPPDRCGKCGTLAWELVHNRCVFADKQMVRLQETPDEVPAGQTPASVNTFCFDDLVDHVHPGKLAADFSCAFLCFANQSNCFGIHAFIRRQGGSNGGAKSETDSCPPQNQQSQIRFQNTFRCYSLSKDYGNGDEQKGRSGGARWQEPVD